MKRTFKILIPVICVISLIGIGIALLMSSPAPENNVLLFDDYYIYRSNAHSFEIYQKEFMNIEKDIYTQHTVFNGWIYKYSFDEQNRTIAVHEFRGVDLEKDTPNDDSEVLYNRYFMNKKYAITEDTFKLYNENTGESLVFNSEAELEDYCTSKAIQLSDWYYTASNGFEKEKQTPVAENCYIKEWLYGYSTVTLNGEDIAFGFVDDVEIQGDIVTFRLRQTKNEYSPESIGTNKSLSPLSDEAVGEYRTDFLTYDDIYYDKTISINLTTGDVQEL